MTQYYFDRLETAAAHTQCDR